MSEKAGVHTKTLQPKQKCSNSCNQKPSYSSSESPADRMLQFQRTAGNQAVQRLIKSRALQAKLRICQHDDIYEQEADRAAEQVIKMPEPKIQKQTGVSRRGIGNAIQRLHDRNIEKSHSQLMEKNEGKPTQTKTVGSFPEITPELESSISFVQSGGIPLPTGTRNFMEQRFGADFSGVRVHTETRASEVAKSINAKVFTIGKNIAFGNGHYSPESQQGRKLLAHELTHVLQQSGADGNYPYKRGVNAHRRGTQRLQKLSDTVHHRAGNLEKLPVTSEQTVEPNDTSEIPVLRAPYWADNTRLQAAVRNSPPLSVGERGEAVALLQGALVEQGHVMPLSTLPDGSMDGVWGSETTATVRAFQVEAGVQPVGGWEAGRKTLRALDARMPNRRRNRPKPTPTDRSEGINVIDVPIARGRRASSASQMAFAVPVTAEPVIGPEDNDKVARIHYQDSVENSIYTVARWLTGNDERRAAEVAHQLVHRPETTFTIDGGKIVDLATYEVFARKKGEVILKPDAVAHFCTILKKTPGDLDKAITAEKDPQLRKVREQADNFLKYGKLDKPLDPVKEKEESRRAGQKRHQLGGSIKVLSNPQVADLYLKTLDRYAKPSVDSDKLRTMAQDGLDSAELGVIIAGNPRRQLITDYFSQGVEEYRAADGHDLPGQFFLLESTLLDQLTWGNPTVIGNQLMIGTGKPENRLGLVHRPDGILFYDQDGTALSGLGGVGLRDPGNRAVPKDSKLSIHLIDLNAIPDPAIRVFFIKLHQEFVDPTLVIAKGADSYAMNYEEVNNLVVQGLDREIINQVEDAVKILAGFLIVRGAAIVLKRQTNPYLKALGFALDATATLYQYYLDIEMLGSLEKILMKAGEFLVRVKPLEKPGDSYDAASLAFMNQAANLIRPIIAQVVIMLLQKYMAGSRTPEARAKAKEKAKLQLEQITKEKRRTSMECNTCQIIWKAGEYSQDIGKDIYKREGKRRSGVKPGEVLRTGPEGAENYPGVEVHPNGNVFGPYEQILAFFRDQGMTNRPSDEPSFESHHLLEDHQMEAFGISRSEGRCVGLERADHNTFSAWMRGFLNRKSQWDIHELYDFSAEMYRDNGHSEYIPQMRAFLRQYRDRIREAYTTGKMKNSSGAGEAFSFLNSL